jgi:ribosome-binding factor A
MSQRIDRIDELLRQEIGDLLTREVQDPHIGFATVTDVQTSHDLGHARVWVSVIGSSAERRDALAALGRAMPFVRRQLGGRLRLRRIPELHVVADESNQRATRVLRILDELERGEAPVEIPPGESLPTPVPRLPHEGDSAEPDPGSPVIPSPGRARSARSRGERPGTSRPPAGRGRPGRRSR